MRNLILLLFLVVASFTVKAGYYCTCTDYSECGGTMGYWTNENPFDNYLVSGEADFNNYEGDSSFYRLYDDDKEFQIIVCERDGTGKPVCKDASKL